MAAPRLNNKQRAMVLKCIAAGHESTVINQRLKKMGAPEISRNTVSNYRKRYAVQIEDIKKQRISEALTTGLALREERIEQLKEHAQELEAIKWEPDERGRLWNEKAWRETVEQIKGEIGDDGSEGEVILSLRYRKKPTLIEDEDPLT